MSLIKFIVNVTVVTLKWNNFFILKQFSAGNKNGDAAIIIVQHSWENVKKLDQKKNFGWTGAKINYLFLEN